MFLQTDRQRNCLNLIRLVAALQVAYGHIVAHMGINMPDAFSSIIGFFQGVPLFFLLSGFLVWDSVDRSKDYKSFLKKRFWRIYPELWIGVIIEASVIVALYGIGNIKQFIIFVITQSTILQFWTPSSLRGYGCGTPNGSLWTIGVLIQFYILIWFIKKYFREKSSQTWFLLFLMSVVLGMVPDLFSSYVSLTIIKLYRESVLNYLYLFIIGAYLAEKRAMLLPFIKEYWYTLIALAIALYTLQFDVPMTSYSVLKAICCGYGLIGFAYSFPELNIKLDISYGLYIYHMIVVNAMITLGYTGKIVYMLIALIISIVLSFISTQTVGLWSVRRKYA